MAKADVLARVRSDLAMGHTYVAIGRLRTLLAVQPDDLELHALLASVYRQTGNLVEAGRWSLLTGDLRPDEQAAFERANPDPWLRARLVTWSGDPDELPPASRERLLELLEQATVAGPPEHWRRSHRPSRARGALVPCLFVLLALGSLGSLAGIGAVRILRWLFFG